MFGKPFRSVNIPQVVNTISGGDCVVEVTFTVGNKNYLVKRGIRPKIFEIYENGKLIQQDAAARDYQQYLETSVLGGINETVFKQIIVIGSADYRPFMQLTSAMRREVIEELLDIKIFSQMGDIVKSRLSAMKEDLKSLDYSIELTKDKLDIQIQNRKRIREENKNKKEKLLEKYDLESKELQQLKDSKLHVLEEKNTLLESLANYDKLTSDKLLGDKLLYKLKVSTENIEKSVSFYKENDTCPECKQAITEDHKHIMLSSAVEESDKLKKSMQALVEKISGLDTQILDMKKIKDLISDKDKQILKYASDIATREKYLKSIKKEIDEITINAPVEDTIKELENYFHDLKLRRISVMEERQYLEAIAGMLKDGGIKTKIIKQYIPVMNKIINEYLNRFALPIEFTLDEQFNEVIKSRYRDTFRYNSFSEGEKQRIDMALLLAWRQIAKSKNTTNTNLLILDETFDSSLDTTATEELLNILLSQDKNTNIFIISHKNDLSDKLRSQITFEKHNNYTRIAKET